MYVLTINDPQGAGAFNNDILASDWYANISNYASFTSIAGLTTYVWSFIFDSADDLNAWVADYGLTDPDLLNSIQKWSIDHGVEYTHKFYTLPEITQQGLF